MFSIILHILMTSNRTFCFKGHCSTMTYKHILAHFHCNTMIITGTITLLQQRCTTTTCSLFSVTLVKFPISTPKCQFANKDHHACSWILLIIFSKQSLLGLRKA